MTQPDISALRASIDTIDDKIIALLNERSGFVKQVGMTKKQRQKDGMSFIRSGREADMVRRIVTTFKDGVFPAAAAAQLWRLIICASLSLESPLTVTAFASDTFNELYWIAREYFGSFTPIARQPTARRVLGDVIDGKAEVGVLPLPDDSAEGSWWLKLPDDVKIFACAPFVLQGNAGIKAFAVAKVMPEETGNDVSFFQFETDMEISQSRLKGLFEKYETEVRWLAVETFPSGHRAHLVETSGFMTEETPALQAVKHDIGTSLIALKALGAYALPITL